LASNALSKPKRAAAGRDIRVLLVEHVRKNLAAKPTAGHPIFWHRCTHAFEDLVEKDGLKLLCNLPDCLGLTVTVSLEL
jgi:hypothetical protein